MKPYADYQGLAAEVYDAIWSEEVDDIPFLTWLLGPPSGRLLELGCGTGRVMLPLIREGWRCDGVDASATMLRICRDKLDAESLPAVLHHQRIESLKLPARFRRIIIPGFTFQHLLKTNDVLKALGLIRQHLLPGGRLILSLFLPWASLNSGDERTWKLRSNAPLERGRQVICHESLTSDPVHQLMTVWNRYEILTPDGKMADQTLVRNQIRWFGLEEFKLLLRASGFGKTEVYSDFTPSSPAADTTFLTFEARCAKN